ncbi:hypothetical protein [Burkholderia alba]|uniref:hypothetical protein n=1 Tax=Burkholderia alba TaxID=2683677 RepID=UPI002B05EC3E|nr:hypothetical protein [Burkholderia alba]
MKNHFAPRSASGASSTQQDSYHSIAVPELSAKQRMVLDCFHSRATLLTREDIADRTNLKLSSVCGRVRELLDDGRLQKRGTRKCIATGKSQELLGLPVA